MTDRSLIHHTFAIERRYPAPVGDVFGAWSDPETKRHWFTQNEGEHSLDFRVGGIELVRAVGANGKKLDVRTRYVEIVENERIVYVTTLSADDELATASVTSVEFRGSEAETVMLVTESDVFLDGQEKPEWREQGTSDQLTRLGEKLAFIG